VGIMSEDLGRACKEALSISPGACREYAQRYSWRACAELFEKNLRPIHSTGDRSGPSPDTSFRETAAAG
jgi:hypothetical protein